MRDIGRMDRLGQRSHLDRACPDWYPSCGTEDHSKGQT
jgi:hypothetical protein